MMADAPRTNWAGNYTYSTDNLHMPKSVAEVQTIVKRCDQISALGSGHSFNGIGDSTENQISLKHLDQMMLNARDRTVTVGAGITYGSLALYLYQNGFAVHNLASLPHISVAGACATGTHGSGLNNGSLSTSVSAMELVAASGEVVHLSRKADRQFAGAVVHLGGLGIVTSLTLDVEPTFDVSQTVYENMSLDHLEKHFDDIFGAAYSVSLFSNWQNHQANQVWIKRRMDYNGAEKPAREFFGAKPAKQRLHPLASSHSAENCTEQMGISGPWHERLPHFRMNFTPSSGAELQTEYFVARDKAYQAILAVEELRDQITPHLFITEFRTIAADNLWMSEAYQRPSMAMHFTWKPEWPAVQELLPLLEAKLAPFQPRPHWAKLFTMKPGYEKMAEFKDLLNEYDPKAKFRNQFLTKNLYG